MMAAWLQKRHDLNHNWLKNKLIVGLNSWTRDGRGRREYRVLVQDVWPACDRQLDAIEQLVNDMEHAMSSARLFDELPLARLGPDIQVWAKPLAHAMWLPQHGIVEKRDRAIAGLVAARLRKRELDTAMARQSECLGEVVAFREACEALSAAISAFPSEILP